MNAGRGSAGSRRALVLEVTGGRAYLLLPDGRFGSVEASPHWRVGEEVQVGDRTAPAGRWLPLAVAAAVVAVVLPIAATRLMAPPAAYVELEAARQATLAVSTDGRVLPASPFGPSLPPGVRAGEPVGQAVRTLALHLAGRRSGESAGLVAVLYTARRGAVVPSSLYTAVEEGSNRARVSMSHRNEYMALVAATVSVQWVNAAVRLHLSPAQYLLLREAHLLSVKLDRAALVRRRPAAGTAAWRQVWKALVTASDSGGLSTASPLSEAVTPSLMLTVESPGSVLGLHAPDAANTLKVGAASAGAAVQLMPERPVGNRPSAGKAYLRRPPTVESGGPRVAKPQHGALPRLLGRETVALGRR
jgi:hypothetical protein